jgi:iron complex transport system ATP-binding protein
MRLAVEGLAWAVEGRAILEDINLHVPPGSFVGLLGPNGSGKSSLLRCIYRVLRPNAGLISLDGEDLSRLSVREVARRTATVLQETPSDFDFRVEDVVLMGRTPHKGMFDRDTSEDQRIVMEALDRVDMGDFAARSFHTLSGGEKQRALIARALVQQAQFLVLDEPTNHLDIRHQLEILDLVRGLGVTALAALHDLNLAASFCDRIYLLHRGRVAACGAPEDLLRPEMIRAVFGVGASVERDPSTGRPRISYFLERAGTDTSTE